MSSIITYNRVTMNSSSLSSSSSSSSSRNSSRSGVRLNPRRFTVQRLLHARAAHVLTIFRRVFLWLETRFHRRRRTGRSRNRIERSFSGRSNFSCSSRRSFLVQHDEYPYGHGGGNYEYRCRTFARSNSFYAEAIADCLDFIKRSSVSSVEHNTPSSSPKQGS